jgi:hypothetical protein
MPPLGNVSLTRVEEVIVSVSVRLFGVTKCVTVKCYLECALLIWREEEPPSDVIRDGGAYVVLGG